MAGHGGAEIVMRVVLALVNSAAAKNYLVNPPGSNSGPGLDLCLSELEFVRRPFQENHIVRRGQFE